MNIVQALLGEHGAIYPLLDRIETGIDSGSIDELKFHVRMLQSTLVSHAEIEETVLRPAIVGFLPPAADGPTDHDIIRQSLDSVVSGCDDRDVRRVLAETLAFTRKHFRKEETQLFRIASRELSEEAQHNLGRVWAAQRGVTFD